MKATSSQKLQRLAAWLLVATMLLRWRSVLADLAVRWQEPQYSFGPFVALAAFLILWRRHREATRRLPGSWWGLPLMALAAALDECGRQLQIDPLRFLSLAIAVFAAWLVAPTRIPARRAIGPLSLLFLALPLPYRLETGFASALQAISTFGAVYGLQFLGYPAYATGHVLHLGTLELGIAEACSGLRIILAVTAIAATIALLESQPTIDRLLLGVSVPIVAVIVNSARLITTGVAWSSVDDASWRHRLHDTLGWLMIPLALMLLWGEARLIACFRQWFAGARPGDRASPTGLSPSSSLTLGSS